MTRAYDKSAHQAERFNGRADLRAARDKAKRAGKPSCEFCGHALYGRGTAHPQCRWVQGERRSP